MKSGNIQRLGQKVFLGPCLEGMKIVALRKDENKDESKNATPNEK